METDSNPPSEADHDSVDLASTPQKGLDDMTSPPKLRQKLACDQCRGRKVGCDRQEPCSRCIRMRVHCQYTAQLRPRPKRPRKVPANPYEAQFDELSRKLDRICKLLEDKLQPNSAEGFSESHVPPTHSTASLPASVPSTMMQMQSPMAPTEASEPEYEGHSALSTHTAFASNLLKNIAGQDAMLWHSNTPSGTSSTDAISQVPGIANLPMPSADMAFRILRILKEDPRMQLPWMMEFESIDQFQEYIFRVYSSSHPTAAEQIILLAAWVSTMPACALVVVDATQKAEIEAQVVTCRDSLDVALSRLPLQFPSTFENILALTMAGTHYVYRSRIKLAWIMNCAAARMAQALGLHKACLQDPETNIATRRKARLFAIIFSADKALSLRLGRASVIRDEEIPVNLRMLLRGVNTAPSPIPYQWLAFSHTQGLVYDQLYSPRAMQQTPEVKQSVAKALLESVETLMSERNEVNEDFERKARVAFGDDLADLYKGANHVSQLALICLIYHGVAPWAHRSPFYEEGIPLAREALVEHQHWFSLLSDYGNIHTEIYLRWALFTSPFIPFIILLRDVVQTSEPSDLKLLGALIESIETMRESFPDISKQLDLFKPLYEIASNFIEAKTTDISDISTINHGSP
ncbi:unnamed protein product [Clonostachys byssicola]|uniref:Zn(2)-C6 fungal-type domain-containing protein n=1 Tax=Clonostachys byssicola TaxID=160290 RepID=A0A9N9UVT0_9HYPO|nr:unnamed protein product [Clonostachys byssicola]